MATIRNLPKTLFEIGKCYKMIRNKKEMKFKVHSYDEIAGSFKLLANFSSPDIGQLEQNDIDSICEIDCKECGKLVWIDQKGRLRAAE